MSLQDVFKAENLGRRAEDPTALAALAGKDLAEIRSEAGCNMLLVYLLNRWGRLFEPGQPDTIAGSEDFHAQVVQAYLRAGCCAEEEVAANQLAKHLPPSFRHVVTLRGKLSARTFLAFLLRELHPDMYPEPYAQLERLVARLAEGRADEAELPAPALEESLALLLWGVHWTGRVEPADGAAAAALGLELVVAGDPANLPPDAELDQVLGLVVARACAEDGAPTAVALDPAPSLSADQRRYLETRGTIGPVLVAAGPLASALLVRGTLGSAADRAEGTFIAGADMHQNPHPTGVWGERVLAVTAAARPCQLEGPDLHLIARYD
jgi:hypothetical protein